MFMKLPGPLSHGSKLERLFCLAKLLEQGGKLGDPVTLTLGSANEFLVGVEPKIPHVEEGMGPLVGLQGLLLHAAPRWAERVPGPRLNAKAGGGAGFQPRPPNRPNQSSRGPPCGHFQEQPRTWCTSPNAGAATRDPHTSAPLSDPKAPRRPAVSIPLSSKPNYFRETGLLAPPGKDLVDNQASQGASPRSFVLSLFAGSLHGRGHNVFFLTEHVKAL